MNKIQKVLTGLGLLALILVMSGTLMSKVEAYRGDPSVKGPYYSEERHEAMENAFEAKDYTSWKNLMGDKGRVTQVINKDNFAKFAEAYELAEKGDLAGAQKIRQELGLGLKNGAGNNLGNGNGRGNCMNR